MELLLVFVLVLTTIVLGVRLAPSLGLLAYPGEHRRHSEPTPMVGGIAIATSLIAVGWSVEPRLLPAILVIVFLGIADDRFKLPSWLRFLAQGFGLWLMLNQTGVQLLDLGELWPNTAATLNGLTVPLTLFAGIGVINAINMSDGMDGLAGAIVSMALLALLFLQGGSAPLIWMVLAAVIAFLCFNLRIGRARASVFLGDAGSTLLGFLLTFFLIKYSQGTPQSFTAVTALWLLALPLFDAVAVLLVRPLRGGSPFSADRIHYHHLLLARGLSVNLTLLIIVLLQATLILAGLWMHSKALPDYIQLVLFLSLFCIYLLILLRVTRKNERQN